jgi:hypothetical protein
VKLETKEKRHEKEVEERCMERKVHIGNKSLKIRTIYSKEMKTTKVSNTNQQLAQKVYKCVNMFLETGSVLRKKGSRRPTERSAENIEEGEQRIIAEINPRN